ncbi:hypothetical protein RJ639_012196 [Escallonia herrerae]|uniref:Reverse transcriptase Ty1/copia-type domain-containing protein n=1 Tax=Escallonia herrerae TaxID=1293975 RepID=A0AA88VMZ8_9ASTE|nr:hypothetical protein RJ639_012196 [Escallonia herrerae]
MANSNPIVPAIPNNPTPPMIVHQDNSTFPSSILNETNYPLWSQLMEMRIGARNKAKYLTGKTKKPALEDPSHQHGSLKITETKESCRAAHVNTITEGSTQNIQGDDTSPQEYNTVQVELLKRGLSSRRIEMKDLGQLKYFLGIEIARSAQGISLSQREYVLDLLTETGMLACKSVENPIEMNHRLGNFPDQAPTDMGRYQRIVNGLCSKQAILKETLNSSCIIS